MQGSTVHSTKKYHRNIDAADSAIIAAAAATVEADALSLADDEFWDYDRQVGAMIDGLALLL